MNKTRTERRFILMEIFLNSKNSNQTFYNESFEEVKKDFTIDACL